MATDVKEQDATLQTSATSMHSVSMMDCCKRTSVDAMMGMSEMEESAKKMTVSVVPTCRRQLLNYCSFVIVFISENGNVSLLKTHCSFGNPPKMSYSDSLDMKSIDIQ